MPFIAHYKPTRLFGLAILGILFMGLGVVMIMEPDGAFDHSRKIEAIGFLLGGNNDLAGHGLGWIIAVFGAAVFPAIIKMMGHREAAIRVDASGIYWHKWSYQRIPWSNVERVRQMSIKSQKFVCLWLHEPLRNPGKGFQRILARANKAMGFGDVAITAQGTDKSDDQLLEAINLYAARYSRNFN